ncbi:MAG: GHKL domain-containing protein [Peptococcaceae bacterium]|nr:GHKL domain-containing protein [Peptococcaceae bacterium]
MTVFDLADATTPFFDACMFFLLFEAFLVRRPLKRSRCFLIGIPLLTLGIAVSNYFLMYQLGNALVMIGVALLVARLFYQGSIGKLILSVIMGTVLMSATEIIVMYFITMALNVSVQDVIDIPAYRFVGIVLSKLSGLAVCYILRLTWREKPFELSRSFWIQFFLFFLNVTMIFLLLFKMSYELHNPYYDTVAVFCTLGLLVNTFSALYLYERLAKQNETIQAEQQYRQHLKEQLKHLDDIVAKQEELRRFKHDMSNQLVALESYFEQDDRSEGRAHIQALMQWFDEARPTVYTGNTALDAILSTKKTLAERQGVRFSTLLQIEKDLPIAPVDICVIFGNALDNAIEACSKVKTADKHIDVVMIQQEDEVFCKITNTTFASTQGTLKTTKADKENHGFGLMNLKRVLEKYDSEPIIETTDCQFTLLFTLFLNE